MLKYGGFLLGLKKISVFETLSEILLVLSQFVKLFRSIFKSSFNLFSDLLMISRLRRHQNVELCNVLLLHIDHYCISEKVRAPKQILVAHHNT